MLVCMSRAQDEILVTDEAPGGYVVLNRARRMNALDLTTVRLLDQQIKVRGLSDQIALGPTWPAPHVV